MNGFIRSVLAEPANVRGILLAVLNGLLLSGVAAIGKEVTTDLPPFQVAFIRGITILIFMAPWFMRVGLSALRPHRFGIHLIRGLASAAAILLWFWALPRVPLADLIALEFTSPLFVIIAAILFLGEKAVAWRIGALIVGFAGSMIIVRPGFSDVSIGILAVLVSAVFFATNRVLAKLLLRTDTATTCIAVRAVLITAFMLPPALYVWEAPTNAQWGWLLLLGVFSVLNQFTATWAIKLADLGAIEPVNFLRLVWGALIGLVLFAEIPSPLTLIGGTIMVASVVYVTRRERTERKG
ncbi:MAG: DMT family transporter [Proteobacteria bacterium]|nr:DMT family transporter [Pseudomonadota bacterium]